MLPLQLQDPARRGIESDRVRIEVVAEVLTAPEPRIDRARVCRGSEPIRAVRMREPALTHDCWMPTLAAQPDGQMLFVGWRDCRNAPDNSMIEVNGRWATIAAEGAVSFFTNDLQITPEPFPPAVLGLAWRPIRLSECCESS